MRIDIDFKNREFWLWSLAIEAIVSVPFVLVRHWPTAAVAGWVAVTVLFVGSVLVFGDGSLIEMGLAAVILASLVASGIYVVASVRGRSDSAALETQVVPARSRSGT